MAGESPDRSKQRESSAEPTSGSGSPVPGARSSARDPRLAVARESVSLAGIDTATRVFSVRDLPKTPEEGAEGPAEAGTGGSGAEGAGDTRSAVDGAEELQDEAEAESGKSAGEADAEEEAGGAENEAETGGSDAVEDTGTAEPRDDVDKAGDSGDSGTGDGLSVTDGAAEGSEGSEGSGKTKAPGATGTAGDAGDTGASSAAEDSGDTATDDSGTAEVPDDTSAAGGSDESGTADGSDGPDTGSGDSSAGESDESAPSGDARLRDAVAAWVATGDGTGSGTAEAAEKPEGKDTEPDDEASEDESGPDTDSAPESDDAETAVAEEAPADDEDHDSDAGESTPSGARGTARPAPTDPHTDDEPDNGPRADAGKPDSPGARGTARPAPTDPQTDDEPDEAPHPGGDGDGDVTDAPPVDQPTAVFKAPRPPVDQPTTMLKLGKAPEAAPKTEPKPKPKPETPAERTSKFVALKGLDEPREARPKADATAAVPQVGPERTTQQPLPPKPPLDLLAELTNTPPPPPSPLRTLGRRVKIWTPILILLVVVFAIVQALRPLPTPTLSLTAKDSYTFDGSKATLPWPTQGQGWMDVNDIGTMGDFGKQTPVAIGSVAKAMTAYIVLKDHPLKSGEEGAKITVDALAEKEGGYNKQGESTLNTVKQGDVLTQKQAISAIMIPSANNIARLLARWDAGSEAAFIKKMNDTAKELGMKNTKYTDASGLKETTVSTAEDQVKLGNELVKIPALMEITKLPNWVDPSGQKWRNYNELVPFNGAIGIKTGTTSAAGGNLLFAATKEVGGQTVTVVGAILGQHTAPIIDTVNAVSKTAMLAARDALTSTKILKKGDVVGYVDDGLGGHTPVVLTKDVTAVGWAGYKVKLSFAADDVPHTAKAGTKVGSLTVGDGEGGAVKVPVTLQKDLTEPGLTDKLTRVG
ncbi:D-alanyl-D-alanine carboxypeptidase [Streptomyces sp. NPDC058307]|uniref:D-alanyl-D-alanine carboxypeptidase n=1 Tax=Streptomyces sp. NPDC058307 TaxID=3346439 RepID=UPI0036E0C51D